MGSALRTSKNEFAQTGRHTWPRDRKHAVHNNVPSPSQLGGTLHFQLAELPADGPAPVRQVAAACFLAGAQTQQQQHCTTGDKSQVELPGSDKVKGEVLQHAGKR